MNLLLDTNIWIDYYVGDRPGHQHAYEFVEAAITSGHNLCYAVTSSRDVFFNVVMSAKRRHRLAQDGKLTEGQAHAAASLGWACLEHMADTATAIGCDASDVWVAHRYRDLHVDYEDNLVIAAAQRATVDFLVTGDKQLLQHCPIASMDASSMTRYLKSL